MNLFDLSFSLKYMIDDKATNLKIINDLPNSFMNSYRNSRIQLYDQNNLILTDISNNGLDVSQTIIKYKGEKITTYSNTSDSSSLTQMISDSSSNKIYNLDIPNYVTSFSNRYLISDAATNQFINTINDDNVIFYPMMRYTKFSIFDDSNNKGLCLSSHNLAAADSPAGPAPRISILEKLFFNILLFL